MLYEPKQKKVWRLVYGKLQFKKKLPTLNIGLLDGHCFYIKDIDVLATRWECKKDESLGEFLALLTTFFMEVTQNLALQLASGSRPRAES